MCIRDRISVDLANTAIVERDAKLEGKNMFLILAPRQTPLGPPRFVHHKDEAAPTVEQAEHVGEHVDDDHHEDDHHADAVAVDQPTEIETPNVEGAHA